MKKLYLSAAVIAALIAAFGVKEGPYAAPQPPFDYRKIGGLGTQIEQKTGIETRVTVLGHVQRGGTPTAYDRVLATRFGLKAVELIQQKQFGHMASLRGTDIIGVPIQEALTQKLLDPKVFDDAAVFFG